MTFKKYLLLLLCLPCFVQAKNITISRLTCEMQEGLVVVESCPRLGWTMESPENGTRQTAYEIEIREAFTGRSVWNSGKVTSSQSQLVPTEGADICLNNPFNYSWRVRVWDETDTPSEWSQETKFRLASDDFSSGKWIGAITRKDSHLPEGRKFHGGELKKPEVKAAWEAVDTLAKKSICLRRTFQTGEAKGKNANQKSGKKIVEATAYVCGLGFYEFSLNGKKIGDSEFAPLWSDYDKSVYYNTYDVTEQLRDGENVVGILLGNGFYNVQGGRYRKLQISFGPPTLLFELVINYEDGTRETIRSDQGWKYDLSPITFNCIYGGEDYDARREQKGWNQVGFNDSHWRPVVVQEAPKGVIRPQMAPPVKIMERYDIQKVTKLNSEHLQTVLQNDLADPGVIGINSGISFFVLLYILVSGTDIFLDYVWMPLAGMIGAVITIGLLMFLIYEKERGIDPIRMTICGVALNLGFQGLILFFSAKLNRQKFSYVQLWNAGILTGTDWLKIALLITILVIIGVILWKYQDVLNIFSLGKESVITLGVDLKKQTIILISLAGFLAAFTIAFGGSIPFVGLIAPHIARRLVGSNHRYSLWVSMLMGSLMVIIGDSLSRSLMSTGEIPTGIILSLIGVPYFIYLLKKERA